MHHLNLNLRLPILPLLFLTIITLLTTNLVQAHRIDIPAGEKACFFEDLHVEDQVRYRVSSDHVTQLLFEGGIRLAYCDFAFFSYPCCSCSDLLGSCSQLDNDA